MKETAHFLLKIMTGIALLCHVSLIFALDLTKPIDFYQHNVWTIEDGLPMNSVISITQTHDGYIWLGTETGLARFDGIDFDVFDHENTPALSNDLIRSLLVDRDGVLWIATRGGGVVRCKNGTFEALTTKSGLLSDEAWIILESNDRSIWIGSKNGLNRFADEKLSFIPLPEKVSTHNVRALVEDRNGCIWVGTRGGGLIQVKKIRDTFEAEYKGLAGLKISALLEDRTGTLWVGTMESGLIRLREKEQFSFTTGNGLSSNYVRCLYEDRSGNLWIGTYGGGINVLQVGKENIYLFDSGDNLSSNSIYTFYEDRERTLWIGTEGGGLNSLRDSKITTYTMKNGLSYDIVFGVFQDSRGKIWVGTTGFGVNYLDLEENQFYTLTTRDGLSADSVYSIAESPEGSLWFGTLGGGVNRLTLDNGQITTFTTQNGLSDNFVRALYVDPKGNLWAGTDSGGVHRFSNGWFILYGNLNFRVNTILRDNKGNLWAGTWGSGLCLLKDEKIDVFDKENGLSCNIVICIYEDKNKTLWLGTYGCGLNRFRYADGTFLKISKKEGLPDNTIYSILEDGKQNLWMSSNRGIFYVNREELDDFAAGRRKTIRPFLFGKEEGMKSIECNGANQPAGWKTRDGKLWFPTTRGVSAIDPESIGVNTFPPPVQIKEIRIDGASFPPGKEAIVPPGEGNLEILYTGLSFIVPEKISFKYKLEGFDDQWTDAGTRRTAYYTRIPPGSYHFRVIACNSDGIWNNTGASFRFQLKSKFYQTLFFKIAFPLCTVLIIFVLYFFLKKVIVYRRLKKKYKHSALHLSPDQAEEYIRQLLYLIEIEKVYQDPDISLNSLAERLKLSPRNLSQVINEQLKKNFHELINKYRVKEARKMLISPDTAHQSVLEIGYEVGFNSKSAFNRAFKHFTQMTPSQFRKKYKCSDS